jgi:hypothetical protein
VQLQRIIGKSSNFLPGLRLLLLLLVIVSLQPAPDLVATGSPQTVQSEHELLGVHTRLTDEVEPWKIKRSLELVRQMGATSIVEFFPWAYYHAEGGSFAWDHPDLVVNHAHNQGLDVIARLGLTPDWARPPDTPLTYLDADSFPDFAEYAAAFSERYAGKVDSIIVGNEPNLSYEWGYRKIPAEVYIELLREVYPAVKEANPEMQVLAGALAPTLEPDESPWGFGDLAYLDEMYEHGAADYFDGLAVHAYGLTAPPGADPDPGLLNFRRIELVREIMLKHGDGDRSIFVTESGWNDHPRWTFAVTPGQRIQYTIDALRFAEKNWPFVEMLAIWSFRYPAPTKSYSDYFTLVTPEFVNKPIYDALKEFTGN